MGHKLIVRREMNWKKCKTLNICNKYIYAYFTKMYFHGIKERLGI